MAERKSRKVPAGRASRLARVAGLASGLAGGMLAEGARRIRAGERPKTSDLILTPGNARRVAEQLATMRGAAMKLGQILSMDTGDLLPREWTDTLARLRSEAEPMPGWQLEAQLVDALGDDWQELLYDFQFQPLASASIGQVHQAIGPKGRSVALKIQYPGIARSIDSDVDNIASLLKLSGVLPPGVALDSILEEVKQQLHEEADYETEAAYLQEYQAKLAGDSRFIVPEYYPELSSQTVLCMGLVQGEPIETVARLRQKERDRIMHSLVELMFAELFEWKMVQTDPNFANYLYSADNSAVVLLDFGATRRFKAGFVNQYKRLSKAALAEDESRLLAAAMKLGYLSEDASEQVQELLLQMFALGAEPMFEDAPYDFAASTVGARMQDIGLELQEVIRDEDAGWHTPPVAAMYFHRKIGGLFMLAARLGARVNVHRIISGYL